MNNRFTINILQIRILQPLNLPKITQLGKENLINQIDCFYFFIIKNYI